MNDELYNDKKWYNADNKNELINVTAIRAYQTNLEEFLFDKLTNEDIDKFYDDDNEIRVTYKSGYEIDIYKCQLTHCQYKFGKVEVKDD